MLVKVLYFTINHTVKVKSLLLYDSLRHGVLYNCDGQNCYSMYHAIAVSCGEKYVWL